MLTCSTTAITSVVAVLVLYPSYIHNPHSRSLSSRRKTYCGHNQLGRLRCVDTSIITTDSRTGVDWTILLSIFVLIDIFLDEDFP